MRGITGLIRTSVNSVGRIPSERNRPIADYYSPAVYDDYEARVARATARDERWGAGALSSMPS